MKKILKKLIPALCLIPMLTGTIGYLISGEMLTDALYASFALYFTNKISDAYNGYIEFSRWTAPLVTATVIVSIIKTVWNYFWWRICLFGRKDSVAVYSDEDIQIKFSPKTKVIYPGECFQGYAQNHILLFSSDRKNLQFYKEHQESFKGKTVYIGLKELEIGNINESQNELLFDWNGSIARLLWKKIALWKERKPSYKIVIYGNSSLAQAVVSTGLQLNLFSSSQRIKYSIISQNGHFKAKYHDMPLMNSDKIRYYKEDDERIWNVINKADLVIMADLISLELLQTVAVRADGAKIYYYAPEGKLPECFDQYCIETFGENEEVLTDENIRRQKLIQKAKNLHDEYLKNNPGIPWEQLSGFLKASNISSADYGEVIAELPDLPVEVLAELEHIRWCRFHFLNYWKYGIPENGKRKDPEKRIHVDLVAYDQLDPAEQEKDKAAVLLWRKQG